jgi:hypothetical protein
MGNEGLLAFDFSSSLTGSGTFSALGVPKWPADSIGHGSGAGATLFSSSTGDQFIVVGYIWRSDSLYDIGGLQTGRATPGTSTFDCSPSTQTCPFIEYITNASWAHFQHDQYCGFHATGSVTLTEVSSTRIKGSFTATGSCTDDVNSAAATVSHGTFDVPVVTYLTIPSQ